MSLVLVIVAVSAALGLAATQGSSGSGTAPLAPSAATLGHDPYALVEADELGWVQLPISTFDDYAAHYYTYMFGDQPIEFFVLKSADGVVRSAFNACDVCYRSLKGYSQDGQIMVCNNCGSQFPADQINIVRGGCNPSPLERSGEAEFLLIHEEDIILGVVYF
ncbi:DUF2318 domain-containing protein [Candidatus Bipolaricaulota bacterium]|nr:DUF2318 domain-containing protein [Candidatus Bipolaricaulota bacterium]